MNFILAVKCLAVLTLLSSTSGVILRCQYRTASWVLLGSHYQCRVTAISLTDNEYVEEILGDHASGKGNSDVKSFLVEHYNQGLLSRIPAGIGGYFENLQGMQWYNGSFTSLSAEDLAPFPDLINIRFSFNQIFSLESNLFENQPDLQRIYLDNNAIEHVGNAAFSHLPRLSYLSLLSNPCIDLQASNAAQLEILLNNLPESCPPMVTTIPPETTPPIECPAECSSLIDELNESVQLHVDVLGSDIRRVQDAIESYGDIISEQKQEILELQRENIEQQEEIDELKSEVQNQRTTIEQYDDRFREIERQLEEMLRTTTTTTPEPEPEETTLDETTLDDTTTEDTTTEDTTVEF